MLENPLTLKFEENETEFLFGEKLNIVSDEKLIKSLGRENIKNGNSTLQIKSLNLLPIYDVIQLKINVLDTGTFLVNFEKEKIDENTRNSLIEKIKTLKNDAEPTKELQIEKIKKLLAIIEEFHPIYATYRNTDILKLTQEELTNITNEIDFTFPLLFLVKMPKEKIVKVKEEKPEKIKSPKPGKLKEEKPTKIKEEKPIKVKEDKPSKIKEDKPIKPKAEKEQKPVIKQEVKKPQQPVQQFKKKRLVADQEYTQSFIDFPLFDVDYIFVTVFSFLLSFGFLVGLYKNKAGEGIAVFLFVMSALYAGIVFYTVYTTLFKRTKEKYKNLKYWISLYIIAGVALGVLIAWIICKFALKSDVVIDDYSKMIWTTIRVTFFTAIASIPGSFPINWIIKKIKK